MKKCDAQREKRLDIDQRPKIVGPSDGGTACGGISSAKSALCVDFANRFYNYILGGLIG